MLEAIFCREVGVFVGGDVLFQWRGTLSVGLTRPQGARGFEGDPAGANPSVGGQTSPSPTNSANPGMANVPLDLRSSESAIQYFALQMK